ncbi:5'/3'-deoxyribonucleotidase [Gluconobacter cerinus]|uniref:5'/3'-deoxyribonucleotidase n=2 Tax=Gluconobacter cerinus TaxID=38307 RepID=A0A1B6VNC3_9PROT|nr:5'/3'-deoxyribonucleotidase [Gluconobacter cerinus]
MKNSRPRLAIDMDEVIADAFAAQRLWYKDTHGYRWTEDELKGHHLGDLAIPEHAAGMQALLHDGHFFADLEVMPGAQDAVKFLSQHFDIFITTAAMEYPASCAPKFQWLQKHFPFIPALNIVFCGHKSILAADFLIDDNVRHFQHFQGQGILFSAPHNLNVEWSPRVANWKDAVTYLMQPHPETEAP